MPSAWFLSGQLLSVEEQVWRDERARYQTAQSTRSQNTRLQKHLAESQLEKEVTREVLRQSGEHPSTPSRGALMASRGLSERRVHCVICMNASALRYQPARDRNEASCERIDEL